MSASQERGGKTEKKKKKKEGAATGDSRISALGGGREREKKTEGALRARERGERGWEERKKKGRRGQPRQLSMRGMGRKKDAEGQERGKRKPSYLSLSFIDDKSVAQKGEKKNRKTPGRRREGRGPELVSLEAGLDQEEKERRSHRLPYTGK